MERGQIFRLIRAEGKKIKDEKGSKINSQPPSHTDQTGRESGFLSLRLGGGREEEGKDEKQAEPYGDGKLDNITKGIGGKVS